MRRTAGLCATHRCETRLFKSNFYIKRSFYQDRLGTNTGKTQNKRRFSQDAVKRQVAEEYLTNALAPDTTAAGDPAEGSGGGGLAPSKRQKLDSQVDL